MRAVAHRSVTHGPVFKDRADVRITPFGLFLRRFSIDELPQLFNVIRGDMSLVGPRPLPLHEAAGITGVHRRRFSMRPGLTCLWQVNGRSRVKFDEMVRLDLLYARTWSLWLDVKILAKTPLGIVTWFSLALGVMGASEGPFWSTAVELGKKRGGTAAAIMNTGGNGGGMLAPIVTPWISGLYGWPLGLALGAAVCVAGALCWLGIDAAQSKVEPNNERE